MATETNPVSLTTTANGQNGKKGMKILVGSSGITLNSCTKQSGASASTTAYILNASQTVIATGSAWSGDVSTFSSGNNLSANTSYYIVIEGSSQTYKYNGEGGGLSYPYSGTYLSWTNSIDTGTEYPQKAWNIYSLDVTPTTVNYTATPSALSLSTTATAPTPLEVSSPSTPQSMNLNILTPSVIIVQPDSIYKGTVGTRAVRKDLNGYDSYGNIIGQEMNLAEISF